MKKGDGSRLIEVQGHHHPDEIPLDFLALGVFHRDERGAPPKVVESENRGERFPLQIPLIRMKSGPESLFEDEGHHIQVWERSRGRTIFLVQRFFLFSKGGARETQKHGEKGDFHPPGSD